MPQWLNDINLLRYVQFSDPLRLPFSFCSLENKKKNGENDENTTYLLDELKNVSAGTTWFYHETPQRRGNLHGDSVSGSQLSAVQTSSFCDALSGSCIH
jgi:hypothetical protein